MKWVCFNTKDVKYPHILGSCSSGITSDCTVSERTANFFIKRLWKLSLGGGRQGSTNQFCKQKSGQRKVKQRVISHRTMQWQNQTAGKSWPSQLLLGILSA